MFNSTVWHDLVEMGAMARAPAAQPVLDSTAALHGRRGKLLLDAAAGASAEGALAEVRMAAVGALHAWCETEPGDLGAGETMADRLFALSVGIADENKDGEVSDDESAVIDIALNAMFDYLVGKGVSEDDASKLLNDGDNEAADRVCELLRASLPEGEESSMEEVEAFAFDAEAQEPLMDSVLDAVYKKRLVIRNGKKVRISKRVSGTVRLTAAQKVAVRKAGMKSRSASARMRRLRSLNLRRKMGL